jgi:cysteine desulfurase
MEPSHVLVAMGALTQGNVRVSFGSDTTADQVDGLVAALREIVPRLREATA